MQQELAQHFELLALVRSSLPWPAPGLFPSWRATSRYSSYRSTASSTVAGACPQRADPRRRLGTAWISLRTLRLLSWCRRLRLDGGTARCRTLHPRVRNARNILDVLGTSEDNHCIATFAVAAHIKWRVPHEPNELKQDPDMEFICVPPALSGSWLRAVKISNSHAYGRGWPTNDPANGLRAHLWCAKAAI